MKRIRVLVAAVVATFWLSSAFAQGPVITSVTSNDPICEGETLSLSAECTPPSTAAGFIRMAGIGGNFGNRSFDQVFSSGDRAGTVSRISEAAFNALTVTQLRDMYDVLLFTWNSSTSLNGDWNTRIKPFIDAGGSVFWEDEKNIGDLSPEITGVEFNGSYGSSYYIVPGTDAILTGGGVLGNFINHHLRINGTAPGWTVYMQDPSQTIDLAAYKRFPSGGGMIVQGPDQDFHASRGAGGAPGNQYQFLLNQIDWLTQFLAIDLTWTGPGGFTATGPFVDIPGATTANSGLFTVTCTDEDGGSASASIDVIVNPTPVITSISSNSPVCEGATLDLTAECEIGGVSSGFTRMAGIGGNFGNRAFDAVFSSGDRPGSVDRISAAAFDALTPTQLRDMYDVLLFTWNSPNLNADWATRIEPFILAGGSVFFEDNSNIGDLSPEVNGSAFGGSYSSSYYIVPGTDPILTGGGVIGHFVNHHLRINSTAAGWTVYMQDPSQTIDLAAYKRFPGGGGMIVQGPDQDYHAVRGGSNPGGNQYQFLLNQIDWLTLFQNTAITWTGPDGSTYTGGAVSETMTSSLAGTWTAVCTSDSGCTATATTDVTALSGITLDTDASDLNLECGPSNGAAIAAWLASNGGAAATSACGSVTWSNDYAGLTAGCGATGSATVTFTATDGTGNTVSSTATITVADGTNPTFVVAPSDLTVECDGSGNLAEIGAWLASNGGAVATDDCGTVTITNSYGGLTPACGLTGSATVTFTATDECGNSSTASAVVTIEDNTPPVITCPADLTISCDELPTTDLTGEASASDACSGGGATPPAAWINEFHYDNAGGDIGEFVEIAGNAGVDLTGWSLVLYNGSGGAPYNTVTLSGVIADETGGYGTVLINFPSNGIQNGSPDGLALVSPLGVVEFLSYEGTLTASSGPAAGMTSTNIGVSESSGTAPGSSLQRCGSGLTGADLTWSGPGPESPGALNPCATLGGGIAVSSSDSYMPGACAGTGVITRTWSATDACGNTSTCDQIITIVDTTAPMIGNFPADTTVNCTESTMPMSLGMPSATDNCTSVDGDAWINEFHYDNAGGDVGEFIEVAGPAGLNLDGYSLVLYNGATGALYNTLSLSGLVIDNEGAGVGAVHVDLPSNGLQNGSPDGIALVNGTTVIEFLSYEGSFTAASGPASGMTSTNVGVSENGGTAVGQSLQLTGSGCGSAGFAWSGPAADSRGSLNDGQTISGCTGGPSITYADDTTAGSCPQNFTIARTWTATDDCGNASSMVQTITVQDTTDPSITCPADIIIRVCDSTATWTIDSDDNCGAVTVESIPPSGSVFDEGTTTTVLNVSTDECGNMSTCSFDVTRRPALELELCDDTSYVAVGYGPQSQANLSVSFVDGGLAPYTYVWMDDMGNVVSTEDATIVAPDTTTTYTVTVTDAEGCTISASHVIVAIDVTCTTGSMKSSSKSSSKSKTKSSKSSMKSGSKSNKVGIILCETKVKSGSKSKSSSQKEKCVKAKSVSKYLYPEWKSNSKSKCSSSKSGSAKSKSKTYTLGPCGSPSFVSETCGEPTYFSCDECELGITSITVVYSGPSGVTVTASTKKDMDGAFQTFSPVNDGDVLVIDGTLRPCGNGLTKKTYLLVDGMENAKFYTKCDKSGSKSSTKSSSKSGSKGPLVGSMDGSFTVTQSVDGIGTVCVGDGTGKDQVVEADDLGAGGKFQGEFTYDAYPNPFTVATTIEFTSSIDQEVVVEVYNLTGVKVSDLFKGEVVGGQSNKVEFRPDGVVNGIYFARITTAEGQVFTKKLILNR